MGLTRRREIADEFEHHLKYALEEGETSRYTKGKNMCAYIYEIRIFLGQFSKQFCALLTTLWGFTETAVVECYS